MSAVSRSVYTKINTSKKAGELDIEAVAAGQMHRQRQTH